MSPEDTRSMCCRLRWTRQPGEVLEKRGGGLFGANPLTGSIGVVTHQHAAPGLPLPDEREFLQRLGELMDLAKESLEIKRKVLERFTDSNLYPYTKHYLRGIRERFGQYWKNHFSTIGLVGLNEACVNLLGKTIAEREGMVFALRVLDFMREKLIAFQEETGNNYNLEATPAEGTSFRLARIDAEKFPGIISANENWRNLPFYTNSSQLPVQYSDDIFEVLDLQDELQTKYTGGTVVHLFVGEGSPSPRGEARSKDLRDLPPALLHADADLQRLPGPRLPPRQDRDLPPLRRGLRGLLARRRLPAAREPVEQGQAGRVRPAADLQRQRHLVGGKG